MKVFTCLTVYRVWEVSKIRSQHAQVLLHEILLVWPDIKILILQSAHPSQKHQALVSFAGLVSRCLQSLSKAHPWGWSRCTEKAKGRSATRSLQLRTRLRSPWLDGWSLFFRKTAIWQVQIKVTWSNLFQSAVTKISSYYPPSIL